ncbi:hypothetical protein ACHAXM_007187 [Skeletonema potamos]|jgi:hypothetical protein
MRSLLLSISHKSKKNSALALKLPLSKNMITRALLLFHLLPFLCLLVLTTSAKQHNDDLSRRLSSRPGYYGKKELNLLLRGVEGGSNKVESSASPPMGNDLRRLELEEANSNTSNQHEHEQELRFLKKIVSTKKLTVKDITRKQKTKKRIKTPPTSPPTASVTLRPTAAVTPRPTAVVTVDLRSTNRESDIVSGVVTTNDDGISNETIHA